MIQPNFCINLTQDEYVNKTIIMSKLILKNVAFDIIYGSIFLQ